MLDGRENLIEFPLIDNLTERKAPKRRLTPEFIECRNELIRKNYKFIKFYSRNSNELINAGVIGFMKAIERFDTDKDTQLSTYCWYWIKQYVSREIKIFYNYPLNFTFKDRLKIKDFLSKKELFKFKLVEEMDENDHHRYSYDVNEEVIKNELTNKLHTAISNLSTREQYVINMRLNHKTLQEIGDSISLTRERIRQIEHNAIIKLKNFIKLD